MSIYRVIRKQVTLVGPKGSVQVKALFDCGATLSFVRTDIAVRLDSIHEWTEPLACESAKGSFLVRGGVLVQVGMCGYSLAATLNVYKKLTEDAILGADFLGTWGVLVDPQRHRVLIDPEYARARA